MSSLFLRILTHPRLAQIKGASHDEAWEKARSPLVHVLAVLQEQGVIKVPKNFETSAP